MRLPFGYRKGSITGVLLLCVVIAALWVDGSPHGDQPTAGGDRGEAAAGGSPPAADRGRAILAAPGSPAIVTRVVDGDTIEVEISGREEEVRYIGIDTPESVDPEEPVQCFAHRASDANELLVGGRRVRLRFDAERRDVYGRLLAYVYRRETLINAVLVRRGLARTLTIAPNDSMAQMLGRLEHDAARAGRGLWRACAP